jgi:hypothetical protein
MNLLLEILYQSLCFLDMNYSRMKRSGCGDSREAGNFFPL